MKCTVFAILLTLLLCGAGCVNIGNKVALISEYKTSSGDSGGTYLFHVDGKNKDLLSRVLEQYRIENPSMVYSRSVPITISWEKQEPDKSLDGYEAFSGLLTFLSLGIWPTIMSDETCSTLRLANETLDRPVTVLIKKRYMIGWLSILPVPAWADWRGKEKDFSEGEIRILKNAIAENLRLQDYQKCLIDQIIRGKGVLLNEIPASQDLVLRRYALRNEPEKWRNIQQIRAESALMQHRISRLYADIKTLGYDPWSKKEFVQLCEQWFELQKQHSEALIKIENSYYFGEYGETPVQWKNSEEVSLEEILHGIKKQ